MIDRKLEIKPAFNNTTVNKISAEIADPGEQKDSKRRIIHQPAFIITRKYLQMYFHSAGSMELHLPILTVMTTKK
jgi:hypothetical protein